MKTDEQIWQEKFKSGDTIKDFSTVKGPPLKTKKSILENAKLWNKNKKKDTLELRIEALEKAVEQIKKYINYSARRSSRVTRSNMNEQTQTAPVQQPQTNKVLNEIES